jgi:signal transduction histidine kinase
MSRNPLQSQEPLRTALALMVLALLLPLGVMIWLLMKGVQTDRVIVRQELIGAYRQQMLSQAQELANSWKDYLREPGRRDMELKEFEEWIQLGGVDACVFIALDGSLKYPSLSDLGAQAPMTLPRMQQFAAITGELNQAETGQLTAFGKELSQLVESGDLLPSETYRALQILVRISELQAKDNGIDSNVSGFWKRFFAAGSSLQQGLSSAQTAFISRRLVALEGQPEFLDAELMLNMNLIVRRFEMQESLLQAYHQGNWRTDNGNNRNRIMMMAGRQFADEAYVNMVNETPRGTLLMHITEDSFTRWLAPLWEQLSSDTQMWIRVSSPWSCPVFDNAPDESAAIAVIDLRDPFNRWTLELGFMDDTFLTRSTRQQTAFSIYAGGALVLLIVFAGFLALHQLNNQIRLNRLKNDFIGMVSHELRTPLASMRMLVDTLIEGRYRNEETLREYLEMISGENHRLSRLVDQFLTFSRMQRGKSQFDKKSVSPGQIVAAALAATKPHLDQSNVSFTQDCESDLPELFADEDAMVTVLINLLENAYKYTGEDKRIRLSVSKAGDSVCFAVEDNGIGIPVREQKLIFREFYQVDNRLSRRSEGSGLGLSINRHIVRAHGGRIEVHSEPGKGSKFDVYVPVPKEA